MFPLVDNMGLWIDHQERSAAEQMAVDEFLWLSTQDSGQAWLRFYQWAEPAITIGYFDPFFKDERPVIRRLTGGGQVEHGEDVTFCLTLPADCLGSELSTSERYQRIHQVVYEVLLAAGVVGLQLNNRDEDVKREDSKRLPCFQKAVEWDLVDLAGKKRVGGAQRKSKGFVIHQGSIRVDQSFGLGGEDSKWTTQFAQRIAERVSTKEPNQRNLNSSVQELLENRYLSTGWNEGR